MEYAKATARDWADAGQDMSDDEIVACFEEAKQRPHFPPNFTMTSRGLTYSVGDDVQLLAGPFEVLAQTRDRFSQAWGILIQWRDDDGQPHQIAIARSQLAGDGREVRQALLHGGLYVSPVAKDRNMLQTFFVTAKIDRRARAVSRIGWQDGSFALPDRTIETGEGDMVVYQGTAALDHEFRACGTLEGWQDQVARLGAGNSRLAIALCVGFVGPLLAATGSEGGGLHLRGPSSIGKSTALLAAGSIWGPPTFVRQWRATANGLEGIAELSNDCLLILDELAQLDPREAGNVAYLLANGTGKSRASQTGEARPAKSWLTFFLSSGEISLAEHARSDGRGKRSPAGQEVRILDIDADAGQGLGLFDTLHGHPNGDTLARAIKDGAAQHYGIAGPEFVRRLLGNLDDTASKAREGIDRFAADNLPKGATGQVARACRRLGLIAMAGEIAIDLGILPWERGTAVAAAKTIFAGWLDARGGAGDAEDRAAIEQVAEFITMHGNSRFQHFVNDGPAVVHLRAGFKRATVDGIIEYLIPASIWCNEVCRGLNPKSVAALLVARGHLIPDGAGKASRTETAPGMGKARFYVVSQSIFGADDA